MKFPNRTTPSHGNVPWDLPYRCFYCSLGPSLVSDSFLSSLFLILMKFTFGIVDLLLFMKSKVGEMSVMCQLHIAQASGMGLPFKAFNPSLSSSINFRETKMCKTVQFYLVFWSQEI